MLITSAQGRFDYKGDGEVFNDQLYKLKSAHCDLGAILITLRFECGHSVLLWRDSCFRIKNIGTFWRTYNECVRSAKVIDEPWDKRKGSTRLPFFIWPFSLLVNAPDYDWRFSGVRIVGPLSSASLQSKCIVQAATFLRCIAQRTISSATWSRLRSSRRLFDT